jgi:hypothetical protein
MKKKKVRLRQKMKNRPKSRSHLKKKRKTMADLPPADDFNRPPGGITEQGMAVMSQVILDFAGPLLETCDDEASERKAISVAIFVWNTALLPEQEQKQTLDSYLSECRQSMPAEAFDALSGYIDQLLESKRTRFAHHREKITNCTFGKFGDNRHIEVGYTMD